jgi:hypothetical protein
MTERVSESVTGQNEPKPTREQRDAAFSSGAGRKAVEEPVEKELEMDQVPLGEAPIGTELETRASES